MQTNRPPWAKWAIMASLVACNLYVALSLTFAQSPETVMFEDTDGLLLDNWNPYVGGHVKYEHPVQFDGHLSVTLDFALAEPVENLAIGHRSGWAPGGMGDVWSTYYLRDLPSGRQTHTILLADFIPPLDHTMGTYIGARDTVLYSVILDADDATDPAPPPVISPEAEIIVDGARLDPQRQVGYTWLRATNICGLVKYTLDRPESDYHGRVFVLDFGECPE